MRLVVAVTGGLVFAASLAYFTLEYATGFDTAVAGFHAVSPSAFDVVLFTVFALHHSVFARTGVKRFIAQHIPANLERSTYVLIASVLFIVVCAAWRPVPGVLWTLDGPGAWLLRAIQLLGVAFTLVSARHLDVLDLAGIRQALQLPSDRASKLDDHGPYGIVRHPIYLGWLLIVWPAPLMNGTRLVFAAISSFYLIVAIPFEERDLRRTFGEAYAKYARTVRYRMLPGIY